MNKNELGGTSESEASIFHEAEILLGDQYDESLIQSVLAKRGSESLAGMLENLKNALGEPGSEEEKAQRIESFINILRKKHI